MRYKVTFGIKRDEPTPNGRIYTKEAIHDIVDAINDYRPHQRVPFVLDSSTIASATIPLKDISGFLVPGSGFVENGRIFAELDTDDRMASVVIDAVLAKVSSLNATVVVDGCFIGVVQAVLDTAVSIKAVVAVGLHAPHLAQVTDSLKMWSESPTKTPLPQLNEG